MLFNLFLGSSAMAICLILQSMIAVRVIAYYRAQAIGATSHGHWFLMRILVIVMLSLVLSNFLQIVVWGALFVFLGEFADFSTSIYHSAVNFATLGYGDIVMSEEHRLLGPLESINGVLMIGFSTAILMGTIQDMIRQEGDLD